MVLDVVDEGLGERVVTAWLLRRGSGAGDRQGAGRGVDGAGHLAAEVGGMAFLRDLAAAICTAELESSWTGSDRVKPEPDEAAWLGR